MAHGGSDEWNAAIATAIAPLRDKVPVALALGMADPVTLQAGLDSLTARHVGRVALVRLFVSGASFRHQTDYLLGLRPDPPRDVARHAGGESHLAPLRHRLSIVTHADGIADFAAVARVLSERAGELSSDPSAEVVLVLAHGVGDDDENAALTQALERAVAPLRAEGYGRVHVETLREDWSGKREAAEARVRAFVEAEGAHGRVLVLPFRLFGFGPYAEVVAGLRYEEGGGLLPHPLMSAWIESTALRLFCDEEWPNPLGDCRAR